MTIESRSRRAPAAPAAPIAARPRTRAMAIPSTPPELPARSRTRASTTEPLADAGPAAAGTTEMATAHVTTTLRDSAIGQETVLTDQLERFPVALPAGTLHVAHVRVAAGATIQPRQYEALRYDVSLTMPCLPTPEAVEEQYRRTAAWVEDKIRIEMENAGRSND